jgi:hypothetical protein
MLFSIGSAHKRQDIGFPGWRQAGTTARIGLVENDLRPERDAAP